MKYLIIILFCISWGNICLGQQYDPEKVNKKAVNFYNLGLDQAQNGNYKEALEFIDKALQQDGGFVDAWLTRAGIYGEMKQYENCIAAYETAFAKAPEYSKDYKLPYAINLGGAGHFQKALDAVNEFLSNPNLNSQSIKAGEYQRCLNLLCNIIKNMILKYVFTKNLVTALIQQTSNTIRRLQ